MAEPANGDRDRLSRDGVGIIHTPDDDAPQNWRRLALACMADMARYASDETPERMLVSLNAYKACAERLEAASDE